MGLFINKESLTGYIRKYCQHCIHRNGKTGLDIINECGVLQMHMIAYGPAVGVPGYDEETLDIPMPISSVTDGDADMTTRFECSLEFLIPQNPELGVEGADDNLQCKMFVPVHPASTKNPSTQPN